MAVTFDYASWVALTGYANVNPTQAAAFFDLATLYFDNSGWPAALSQAPKLLNLLTGHIAWLFAPRDAQGNPSTTGTMPPPGQVGRLSSGTQGSISVPLEYESNSSPSEAWYLQSQWGAAYWAATSTFRTGFYIGGPQRARRAAAASYIFPGFGRRLW